MRRRALPREPPLTPDERTEMMLSDHSFPALLEERERRLAQDLERERLRRERAAETCRPPLISRLLPALRRGPARL